jgi:hypothetical protein
MTCCIGTDGWQQFWTGRPWCGCRCAKPPVTQRPTSPSRGGQTCCPLITEPIVTFLAVAGQRWQAIGGTWCSEQAHLASLFAACVRLVQDRVQMREAVTLDRLRHALGA